MSRFVTLLCAFVLSALPLFSQAFTGSISGIVTDASGAVLPQASITVTDLAKNTNFHTQTNDSGFYLVGQLSPGSYRITAEKAGFRKYNLDAMPLSTQQKASVDIPMEVGALSDSVSVTGEAQLVESTTSTLGAVIENKRILDLPLNGRNIFNLAALVPGVFMVRQTSGIADTFTANRFIVNGGQESTSDILLDGVTATVSHNISTIPAVSAIPSVEGIQEFKIQTNAYSAEYGRSGGGLITLVTKSGTNDLHGSAYEFLRNSYFDANNFFQNRLGRKLTSFKRNQFGGSFGGPVYIPKLYNGRNKTFFFFDYEGQRILSASPALQTVPSELERRGDFSQTLNAQGQLKVIYDPLTTRPDPNNPGKFLRSPFPGNVIPPGRMDPVALKAQTYYPLPNNPGLPFSHQNNFAAQAAYPQPQDRVELKIDHVFNDRQRMFGRYTFMDSVYSKPNYWGNIADPGCCDPMNQRLQNAAFDYVNTLNNTTVLNIRYGFGRVSGNRYPWSKGFQVSTLGLPASIDAISNQPVFPTVTIQDYTQLGPNGGDVYLMGDATHSIIAALSKVSGRHSLRYGVDARFNMVNYGQLGTPSGTFNFERVMTQGPDPRAPTANAGVGYASFLLGTGSNGATTAGGGSISHQIRPANANKYFAVYAQDDFKVSRKLTVNAGLRWDFEHGVTERYDHLAAIDIGVKNPVSDLVGMDLRGGYLFAGGSLGRRAIRDTSPRQINPRLGLVYELNPKTVVRMGYGIFYGLPSYAANSAYTSNAFQSSTPWLGTIDGVNVNTTLSNPFPGGYNFSNGAKDGLLSQIGLGLSGAIPDTLQPVYNQQWNLNVQRNLGRDMLLEVAYAGNRGTHLALSSQLDQLRPEQLALGNSLLELVPNPFYKIVTVGALAQPTVQRGQLLRPYPLWNGVSATNAAWSSSNYNALQARFEKRYSRGLSVLVSYTFSKTMSDGADGLWNNNGAQIIRNWYCRRCDYSISSYDQPHRFVSNVTYELPIGRGKMLGSNWNRFIDTFLGQWQMNGILTMSEGQPLRFTTSQNTSNSFGGGQTPDSTGINANLGSKRTIDRWFDTSQFTQPAPFTFGNMARSTAQLRNANARNIDFSLFKSFRITERIGAQFRGEAFNLTNTPLFGNPGTTLNTPTFGVVTSQENSPRQIQLGLKILF
ncbi:MAG: TonB-dependent receptor [Acidobacteriota bacterium]|nr:TonB-dependent receptor [Acidobacteriota bacterium]